MIAFSRVSKQYGRQVLFVEASFQLNAGERVGLVGPNGSGKTTLFRMVVREESPDEGEVSVPKRMTIGYFRQDVEEMAGRSVLDETIAGCGRVGELHHELEALQHAMADPDESDFDVVLARFGEVQEEYDHLGGYALEAQAREVLHGLGFDDDRIDGDVGALSGGWKMRVAMARALLGKPDVLLLDEPTNHLDIESIIWLETFLRSFQGALLMTSHDREFMNRVVTKIAEIDDGEISVYSGDYDFYERERAVRDANREAAYARQQAMLAKERRFIERFAAHAAKAAQVQSRVKALDKIEKIELPKKRRVVSFDFRQPPRSGDLVATIDGVCKAYGRRVVYDGLSMTIRRGERWAVMGRNGAGKTTLLKMVAGALAPDSGTVTLGASLKMGYFAQQALDLLDADLTIEEQLEQDFPHESVGVLRNLAGAFQFSGDDVDKKIKSLSGGEKTRLVMARMLLDSAELPRARRADEPPRPGDEGNAGGGAGRVRGDDAVRLARPGVSEGIEQPGAGAGRRNRLRRAAAPVSGVVRGLRAAHRPRGPRGAFLARPASDRRARVMARPAGLEARGSYGLLPREADLDLRQSVHQPRLPCDRVGQRLRAGDDRREGFGAGGRLEALIHHGGRADPHSRTDGVVPAVEQAGHGLLHQFPPRAQGGRRLGLFHQFFEVLQRVVAGEDVQRVEAGVGIDREPVGLDGRPIRLPGAHAAGAPHGRRREQHQHPASRVLRNHVCKAVRARAECDAEPVAGLDRRAGHERELLRDARHVACREPRPVEDERRDGGTRTRPVPRLDEEGHRLRREAREHQQRREEEPALPPSRQVPVVDDAVGRQAVPDERQRLGQAIGVVGERLSGREPGEVGEIGAGGPRRLAGQRDQDNVATRRQRAGRFGPPLGVRAPNRVEPGGRQEQDEVRRRLGQARPLRRRAPRGRFEEHPEPGAPQVFDERAAHLLAARLRAADEHVVLARDGRRSGGRHPRIVLRPARFGNASSRQSCGACLPARRPGYDRSFAERSDMKRLAIAVCLLALLVPAGVLAQKEFAPTVRQFDKAVDLSKFKTYEWVPGHKALDPEMDKAIIAAIDKEMAARGFKKGSPADVAVAYHAVQRADVDLSTFDNKQPAQGAERAAAQVVKVGTLVIDLTNPTTKAVIWRVSGEGIMKEMPAADRNAFVARAVSALFSAYPKK